MRILTALPLLLTTGCIAISNSSSPPEKRPKYECVDRNPGTVCWDASLPPLNEAGLRAAIVPNPAPEGMIWAVNPKTGEVTLIPRP